MNQIQNIVVAVDFKPESSAALARAEVLAKQLSATLHLIHGIHSASASSSPDLGALPGIWDAAREQASNEMIKLHAELRSKGVNATTRVRELDPVRAILANVEAYDADLVVMGTHGYTGLKHAIFGSVAEGVLRKAACPVITVREDEASAASPIRQIVVATDLSDNSAPAVEWGFKLAAELGASIDLLHAFSFQTEAFPHTKEWDQEIAEKERAVAERVRAQCEQLRRPESPTQSRVLKGDSPEVLITRFARNEGADLIVLGTHGYTGLKHALLGSVAERTLHQSKCSVMTLRSDL